MKTSYAINWSVRPSTDGEGGFLFKSVRARDFDAVMEFFKRSDTEEKFSAPFPLKFQTLVDGPLADLLSFEFHHALLSEKAMTSLKNELGSYGAFHQVDVEGHVFYIFRIYSPKVDISKIDDLPIDIDVFRVSQRGGSLIVSDGLRKKIEALGLTGFEFRPIKSNGMINVKGVASDEKNS